MKWKWPEPFDWLLPEAHCDLKNPSSDKTEVLRLKSNCLEQSSTAWLQTVQRQIELRVSSIYILKKNQLSFKCLDSVSSCFHSHRSFDAVVNKKKTKTCPVGITGSLVIDLLTTFHPELLTTMYAHSRAPPLDRMQFFW